MSPKPPPLPENISARLQATLDPLTGRCRHHPSVQLCALNKTGTRWVVRRKVCYKCGSRSGVAVKGSRHRAGVAVANPNRDLQVPREEDAKKEKAKVKEGPRSRSKSRSASEDRSGGRERRSSASAPSSGGGRRDGSAGRERRGLRSWSRPRTRAPPLPPSEEGAASSASSGAPPYCLEADPVSAPVPDGDALVLHAPMAAPHFARVGPTAPAPERRRRRSPRRSPARPPAPAPASAPHDPLLGMSIRPTGLGGGENALPPPPPRTLEEMKRVQEQLKLRQAHIRHEQERRVNEARDVSRDVSWGGAAEDGGECGGTPRLDRSCSRRDRADRRCGKQAKGRPSHAALLLLDAAPPQSFKIQKDCTHK